MMAQLPGQVMLIIGMVLCHTPAPVRKSSQGLHHTMTTAEKIEDGGFSVDHPTKDTQAVHGLAM